ncbi:uncharacterized protein [Triticum aestivum]|uniref:uncharacterized protein n=1 Tax=Triticum aestivum TaxID=4565 RepID=UPI000844E59A|nr:uncharacterized protein LOC123080957 [Triticum aestivum]
MTKILSFSRSKRADRPEEEEESAPMVAAGEYRDLEGGGNKDEGPPAGAGDGGAGRGDVGLFLAGLAAYFVSFIGIYYILLGKFYLPPEAGEDGGGPVVKAGAALLAVAGATAGGVISACCCCRRASPPADDEPSLVS